MNENRMKTSTNTGEVSLPSAKESGLDRKSSNLGQMSPHGYLLRLGNGLLTGQCWREGSKNSENNHLETVNIESNGKSRMEASTFTTTTTLVVSLKSRFGGKVPGDADMDARSRAGDIIQIGDGAISPHSSYLGGVSFDEAPEPSTWALLLAGVAFLGFRMRNKIARFQA
jgi:hypothetical protein